VVLDGDHKRVIRPAASEGDLPILNALVSVLDDVRAGFVYGHLDVEHSPFVQAGLSGGLSDKLADDNQLVKATRHGEAAFIGHELALSRSGYIQKVAFPCPSVSNIDLPHRPSNGYG